MVRLKRQAGTKLSGSKAFKVLATMPLFTQFYKVKVDRLSSTHFRDDEVESLPHPCKDEEVDKELTKVIEDIAHVSGDIKDDNIFILRVNLWD